jgi:hypothetical protein
MVAVIVLWSVENITASSAISDPSWSTKAAALIDSVMAVDDSAADHDIA